MNENSFASVEDIFRNIYQSKQLTGSMAESAKDAVSQATWVNLDYYVPCQVIEDAKKHCQEKLDFYGSLGAIAQVECYTHFLNLLTSMWQDPEER